MKFLARFLLVFFVFFLATPTIVSVIKKNTDISMFYSFNEEELNKDFKELKADLSSNYEVTIVNFSNTTTSKIVSENLSRHDNVSEQIFSPPPELS
ncbi:MAG: hypothetical protein ACOYBS_11115 [Flavobacterium sp.]